MLRKPALTMIFACGLALPAQAEFSKPAMTLAAKYCAAILANRDPGPDLLSASLLAAIAEARLRHDAYDAGVPLQGIDIAAPKCVLTGEKTAGGVLELEIDHQFPDDSASDWFDRLVTLVENGELKIDDIRFSEGGHTLREALLDPSVR